MTTGVTCRHSPSLTITRRYSRSLAVTWQLVFVSATVAGQGAGSIGSYLGDRFPDLRWIRSEGAHRPVSALTSEFVKVSDATERKAELLRLCEGRRGRTLVFANSASRAIEASRALAQAGLEAPAFHPDVPPTEREVLLSRFAASADGAFHPLHPVTSVTPRPRRPRLRRRCVTPVTSRYIGYTRPRRLRLRRRCVARWALCTAPCVMCCVAPSGRLHVRAPLPSCNALERLHVSLLPSPFPICPRLSCQLCE